MKPSTLFFLFFFGTQAQANPTTVGPEHPYIAPIKAPAPDPGAIGWGNLFLPGLGATLRGNAPLGLLEASTTVGFYYGGTFLAEEAHFSMDGSVKIPNEAGITRQLTGQFLQEVGLKVHMYNTFYNYQQASLDPANAEAQKEYQQPLYTGNWKDMLAAPFRPKNWEDPWFYIPLALSSVYLYLDYKGSTPAVSRQWKSNPAQDSLFGFTQGIGVPLGSAFGEEALWRGFFQREFHKYTGSLTAAVLMQTALFVPVHQKSLRPGALVGGIYFGLFCHHTKGDLEPLIATHFWVDFVSALFTWMKFRQSEGRGVPLSAQLQIPLP